MLQRIVPTIFAILFALAVAAAPLTVKVVGVTDGDTLTALDANNTQAKIRLNGVDCPESGQAFGTKAKEFTSSLCFGKIVQIEILDTDRYGRFVATVTLPDGKDLNQELVKAGMAWWYEQYAPNDAALKALQEEANAQKRGLWTDPSPVAPWEFRKGESQQGEPQLGTFPQSPKASPQIRAPAPQVEPQGEQVYVTRTGEKYHRESCRYLSKSKIPMAVADAKARYGACSVCRPPG